MKAISERQSRLLAQAIASPRGAVPLGERGAIADAGNSFAALVRHGLMVVAEDEEGVRRLEITSAGRAAISIVPTPDRVRRKVKRASRTHDAIAGLEPPEPSEEESEIAAQVRPRGGYVCDFDRYFAQICSPAMAHEAGRTAEAMKIAHPGSSVNVAGLRHSTSPVAHR